MQICFPRHYACSHAKSGILDSVQLWGRMA